MSSLVLTLIQGFFLWLILSIVATTHWNGTCSMLTSAKLSINYLVVRITRELDKEPLLYCSSIYINTIWSMLQQYLLALIFMSLPYVLVLIYHASTSRLLCYVHVPWHHTLFNLHHHACTMYTLWGTYVSWHHP